MALLSDVLTQARDFLNDNNITQSPNETLIPKVQEAHRELQTKLWNAGSPVVRGESTPINVPANTSELGALTPANLITPFEIWENAFNAPVNDANWIPVTETFNLPFGVSPGDQIKFWSWREEKILLLQASVIRAIIIKYRKLITVPVNPGDQIGLIFGELYLSARSAGIFAGVLGNQAVLEKLTELANMNLAEVIRANRGSQASYA